MENQRIRLTKRLIGDSLIRLMSQKDIRQINVSELCRHAGINRATFYRYYNTPEDVLSEIHTENQREYESLISKTDERIGQLTVALNITRSNAQRAQILNHVTNTSLSEGQHADPTDDIYYSLLAAHVPEPMHEYARHMTSAAMTVWLKSGCALSDRAFAELLIAACHICQEKC